MLCMARFNLDFRMKIEYTSLFFHLLYLFELANTRREYDVEKAVLVHSAFE
jgi:hypothetical protein